MRRIILHAAVALITFWVGISVAGAWNLLNHKPTPRKIPPRVELRSGSATETSNPVAEEEIRQIYRDYAVAQTNHDASFFKRVEADSFILTDAWGNTLTRDQDIAAMKTWDKNIKYSNDVLDIQFYGDAAVVRGEMTATYPDRVYSPRWRCLDVLMRRNGDWQILSTTQIDD